MIINLIPDDSVARAPAGFSATIRAAADLLQQNFTNNITINIRYGWGTWNNRRDPALANTTTSLGGALLADYVNYVDVKNWLGSKPTLPQDEAALASLPTDTNAFPINPAINGGVIIASAEEKALGHWFGSAAAIDGAVGFGTATTPNAWFSLALHEITHAMGRESGIDLGASTIASPWVIDLFRYSGPNTFRWSGTEATYFSLNGGISNLASFDTYTDTSDFAASNLLDPFDAIIFGGSAGLTWLDISVMDVLGFTPVGARPRADFLPPSPSNSIAVFDTTTGQAVTAVGEAYSGPVGGLQHTFIYAGRDNVNITVADDDWFLHGGPGDDALSVLGGYNVLDGGAGSNFLTGGSGTDTFFVDDRSPPADIWSTVTGFHSGDDATVFGIVPAIDRSNIQWVDNQGTTGFTGLTLHVLMQFAPTASLTLPGYTTADLTNGRLSVGFGNEPDGTPFMHIVAHT